MQRPTFLSLLTCIVFVAETCISGSNTLQAQNASSQPASRSLPSIEDKTKGLKAFPGFFNFYWDEHAGKVWLAIDKLDKDILYQPSLSAGLGSNDVGMDR